MVIEGTCYFVDSYPFNLSEDLCEEFREIYGDPVYDTYDDENLCKRIYGPPIYDDYVAIVTEEDVDGVTVKDDFALPKFELGLAGCNNWETQRLIWESPIEGLLRDQAFRYKVEFVKLICTLSAAVAWDSDMAQGHVLTSCYIIMESARIPPFFMARLIHRYTKVNIDEVCQDCLLASQEFCYWMAGKDILFKDHG